MCVKAGWGWRYFNIDGVEGKIINGSERGQILTRILKVIETVKIKQKIKTCWNW